MEEQEQKRDLAGKLSEIATSVAHEMKTPLTAASAAMHMLQAAALMAEPEEQSTSRSW